MKYTRDIGERCFTEHKVNRRSCYAVADEIGTSPPNVTRWAKRFETESPARAAELRTPGGPDVSKPATFMDRVRAAAADDDVIPGFEPGAPSAPEPPGDVAKPRVARVPDASAGSATDQIRETLGVVDQLFATTTDPEMLARLTGFRVAISNNLLRAEKNEKESKGVITLDEAVLTKARAALIEKQEQCAESAKYCAECGARIRLRRASSGEDAA